MMHEKFIEMYKAGIPLAPCGRFPDRKKAPFGPQEYNFSWKWDPVGEMDFVWLNQWEQFGIRCGSLPGCRLGDFEVIDFDKALPGEAGYGLMEHYLGMVTKFFPAIIPHLYIEKTPRGGHIIFRALDVPAGEKLAVIRGQEVIETRGAGHFCVVAPSHFDGDPAGYRNLGGTELVSLPHITAEARKWLMDLALSYNDGSGVERATKAKPAKVQVAKPEPVRRRQAAVRPVDIPLTEDEQGRFCINPFEHANYAADPVAWFKLMTAAGWTPALPKGVEPTGRTEYIRPDKFVGDGVSANVDFSDGMWLLYNFSSSVEGLDSDRAYNYSAAWHALRGDSWEEIAEAIIDKWYEDLGDPIIDTISSLI